MPETMVRSDFRVLIVGGGPNGLTAAHMLSKAGIDFVVLERRNTVEAEVGASLALGPDTVRVYDQLGILEAAKAIHHPLFTKRIVTHEGEQYYINHLIDWAVEDYGHRPMMMHRPELVQMLYNCLSDDDRKRVLTGKDVVDVETQKDGVVVKCADGTKIKGSVVIGADGVHSQVRAAMRRLALKESPTAKVNDEKPLLTTYRCLFATVSLIPGMYPGEMWGGHGFGASTQSFIGRDRAWFFVYEQLDKPTRERHRYSQKDVEQFVEKWGHLAITNRLTVKDFYGAVQECTLTDLQEGLMKVFAHDRVTIVGDAVCKHTPNAGLGYNGGVQDLVAVVTALYRLLQSHPADRPIDSKSVGAALQQYQKERERISRTALKGSAATTRMQAGFTWKDWMMERWIVPKLDLGKTLFQKGSRGVLTSSKVLPYLEEKQLVQGKVPWGHFPDGVDMPKKKSSGWGKLVTGILLVAPCLWFGRDALLAHFPYRL